MSKEINIEVVENGFVVKAKDHLMTPTTLVFPTWQRLEAFLHKTLRDDGLVQFAIEDEQERRP